jgi:DNA-binding response OmpR family regulator
MLIDDDRDYAEVLKVRLSEEGYQVEWFATSEEAIRRLEGSGTADLIILDVEMPERNGLATLTHLKKRLGRSGEGPVPIMIATGLASERLKELFEAEQVADYIRKPFDSKTLIKRIEAILSHKPV